ncbi:hypothetical protein PENTCL1PPCAC_25800, partial [Pristionchus entomophagus]
NMNMNIPDPEHVKRLRVIKDQSEVILDYYACNGKNWLGCMFETMVSVINANVDKRNSYQYRKEVMATFNAYIGSPQFDGVAERDKSFSACLAFANAFGAYVEEMNSRTMEGNTILFQEATEESLKAPIDTRIGLAIQSRKRVTTGPDAGPLPIRRPIKVTPPLTHLIMEMPERRTSALKRMVMPPNPREQQPSPPLPVVQLQAFLATSEDRRSVASVERESRESSTFTPRETTPMPVTPVAAKRRGSGRGGETLKTALESLFGGAALSSAKDIKKMAKGGGYGGEEEEEDEDEEEEERGRKRARRHKFGIMGNRIECSSSSGADSDADDSMNEEREDEDEKLNLFAEKRVKIEAASPTARIEKKKENRRPDGDAALNPMDRAFTEEDDLPLKKKSVPDVVLNELGLEEESMDERDVEEEIGGSDTSLAEWTGPNAFKEVNCFQCEKVCPTYKCLSNHLYHAHKGISTHHYIFQCRGCEKEFRSYRGALGHINVAIRKREAQCKGKLAYLGDEMMMEVPKG